MQRWTSLCPWASHILLQDFLLADFMVPSQSWTTSSHHHIGLLVIMLSDGLHLLFSRFTLSEWFKWNVLQWSDQAVVGGTHKKVLNSLNLYFNKKRPQPMRQQSENNMLCLFWSESKQLVQRLKPNLFNRTQVQTLTCPSVPGRPFVCKCISAQLWSSRPLSCCAPWPIGDSVMVLWQTVVFMTLPTFQSTAFFFKVILSDVNV